jgi:hypothetical protein
MEVGKEEVDVELHQVGRVMVVGMVEMVVVVEEMGVELHQVGRVVVVMDMVRTVVVEVVV